MYMWKITGYYKACYGVFWAEILFRVSPQVDVTQADHVSNEAPELPVSPNLAGSSSCPSGPRWCKSVFEIIHPTYSQSRRTCSTSAVVDIIDAYHDDIQYFWWKVSVVCGLLFVLSLIRSIFVNNTVTDVSAIYPKNKPEISNYTYKFTARFQGDFLRRFICVQPRKKGQ
jgi:hypothetical protein